eukprot:g2610.t1
MRQHPSSEPVQEKGANALRLLVKDSPEAQALLLKLGAAEVLVHICQVHLPSLGALSAALHALSVLSRPWRAEQPEPWSKPEILLATLQRCPESNSILEPGLTLLWGYLAKEPSASSVECARSATAALRVPTASAQTLAAAGGVLCVTGAEAVESPGAVVKLLLKAQMAHPDQRMLQERAWEAVLMLLRASESLDEWIGCDIMTLLCLPDAPNAAEHRQLLMQLEAPRLVAEAMKKNLPVPEMQELKTCLALDQVNEGELEQLEDVTVEALLLSLEAQPHFQAAQTRALDLLSSFAQHARWTLARPRAAELAVAALKRHAEDATLVEIACRLLWRLLEGEVSEPMDRRWTAKRGVRGSDRAGRSGSGHYYLGGPGATRNAALFRVLAANGAQPAAEAAAPPLLSLQLMERLAQRRSLRPALRRVGELWRKLQEALSTAEDDEGAARTPTPISLCVCGCALLGRLACDGEAAAAQASVELERLMKQIEASDDVELQSWGFLALQNLLCGSTSDAQLRRHTAVRLQLASELRRAVGPAEAQRGRLETILMMCFQNLVDCIELQELQECYGADEVLALLLRALGTQWALEALETLLLEALKDHLALEEDPEVELRDELLFELWLPAAFVGRLEQPCHVRAMEVCSPELLLEAMQALPLCAALQVTSCGALRRYAMTATAARAAHAAPPGRRVAALEQRLARSTAATMDAMRSHEKCAEERDQRASVLALHALLRLSCSLEGEDVAVERLATLEAVPILLQRGLDALRVLATRRADVTELLCELKAVLPVVEAMNLNIFKPKIQERKFQFAQMEIAWQGGREQQMEALKNLGVEAVVRALKAFPQSGEVQTSGLAAILELVLEAMGNFPLCEGVQAFGCAALISLVHTKPERVGALADLNCTSMVESAMVGHPKSKRVLELADHLMTVLRKGGGR